MADLVAGDVTYAEAGYPFKQIRDVGRYTNKVTLTFGDGVKTYPAGGIPLTGNGLGFPVGIVESVQIFDQSSSDRIDWYWDVPTNKLRAFKAPVNEPIIEEIVPVAANVGVLKQLPAHIFLIEATAGTTVSDSTHVFKPRISTATVGSTEVAVNYATGTLTFFATDAVTECVVSYLPLSALQRKSDLVIEEAVTVTANVGTLANLPCAVGVFEATTGTVTGNTLFRSSGVTPLTHQVAINFTTGTGTFLAGDAVTAAVATYIKAAAFQFVIDETVTLTASNTTNGVGALTRFGIPSYGVYCDAITGTALVHVARRGSIGPSSLGNAQWQYLPYPPVVGIPSTSTTNGAGIVMHDAAAEATCKMTYIKLPASGLASPGQFSLEELRSPLLDTVPPTTLTVWATGY